MNSIQKQLLEQLSELGEVRYVQKTKAGLIKAIAEMDIECVDGILEDNLLYQNVTKELYLQKLAEVFDKFKTEDNYLIPHAGSCKGEFCPNVNKTGVAFLGNNSQRSFKVIIEQSPDGSISDLYDCHSFRPDEFEIDENNRTISISVFLDEKAAFYRGPVFNENDNEAVLAIAELLQFENSIVSSDYLRAWQKNYEPLQKKLEWSFLYKNLNLFSACYNRVSELCSFLDKEKDAENAIADYHQIDISAESELLKWLVKYEQLFSEILLIPGSPHNEADDGKQKLTADLNVYFSTEMFAHSLTFYKLFDIYYYDKLEQYDTLSIEDQAAITIFPDDYGKTRTLKHHLEKRGII